MPLYCVQVRLHDTVHVGTLFEKDALSTAAPGKIFSQETTKSELQTQPRITPFDRKPA